MSETLVLVLCWLVVVAATILGNFLVGLLNAEALGLRLRDWLFRRHKRPAK